MKKLVFPGCLKVKVSHQGRPGATGAQPWMFFFSFVLQNFQVFLCLINRSVYPGGHGQYSRLSGCGLLRLHSTYRHDLKIYAADEGRVQMTAAAFAKVSESYIFTNKICHSLVAFRSNKDVVNSIWY